MATAEEIRNQTTFIESVGEIIITFENTAVSETLHRCPTGSQNTAANAAADKKLLQKAVS